MFYGKGYVFPDGAIFDDVDHADAWDEIPSTLNPDNAIKYVRKGNEIILQGKLTKPIANAFRKHGFESTDIRYGSVDDEMLEINKKVIRDKIDNLGWVSLGGGYEGILKRYKNNDELTITHIKTPDGKIYKEKWDWLGVTTGDMNFEGGPKAVLKRLGGRDYVEVENPVDLVKNESSNKLLNKHMNKFLELCEEYDPIQNENPKWKLIDFLKSKGINVSLIRDTDMLYIDTGEDTIPISIEMPEEEAESIDAGYGDYNVNDEVEGLAKKASNKLGAGIFRTSAQKAKSAVKKRQNMSKKAVDAYDKKTQKLERDLQNVQ